MRKDRGVMTSEAEIIGFNDPDGSPEDKSHSDAGTSSQISELSDENLGGDVVPLPLVASGSTSSMTDASMTDAGTDSQSTTVSSGEDEDEADTHSADDDGQNRDHDHAEHTAVSSKSVDAAPVSGGERQIKEGPASVAPRAPGGSIGSFKSSLAMQMSRSDVSLPVAADIEHEPDDRKSLENEVVEVAPHANATDASEAQSDDDAVSVASEVIEPAAPARVDSEEADMTVVRSMPPLPPVIDFDPLPRVLSVSEIRQSGSTAKNNVILLALVGAVALAFVSFGLGVMLVRQSPQETPSHAETAATGTLSVPLVWQDLLRPGPLSPRGSAAADISADQAFTKADTALHGIDGKSDTEEARYWFRVGIEKSLSGGRLPWALTQLGTLYARPQATQSEFAVARSLWELAAAKGDPVALCFLAALEESGLAHGPNKANALKLYREAQSTGACDGADMAILRLSK